MAAAPRKSRCCSAVLLTPPLTCMCCCLATAVARSARTSLTSQVCPGRHVNISNSPCGATSVLATLIRTETTLDHSSGMAPTVGLLEELPCLGGLAHAHCGCTARPSDLQMAVLCRQDHCNGDDTRCAVAPMQDHVMRWPRWQVPRPTTEYSSRCCRL